MTLNKDGLEAAHAAYERYGQKGDLRSQRLSDGCLSTVITAYLKVVDERLSAAEQQVRDMRAGLEFYRDGFTFTTNPRYGGLEWKPTETLLDDCGNTARLLLKESGRG